MAGDLRAMAAQTLEILDRGWYTNRDGRRVDLADDTAQAVCHGPDDFTLRESGSGRVSVEVTNETTFHAAARLKNHAVCLNFASATRPGGGFINGARAQEESLARASTLYPSLLAAPEFYAFHRRQRDPLYSDRLIYSPHVQVFRDDRGALLAQPYSISVITAAAPNAGRVDRRRMGEVAEAVRVRSGKILAAAALHGHRTLVLGAWGCGVFRNDPAQVAGAFRDHLDGSFAGAFDHVVFAVLDNAENTPTLAAFKAAFST